MNHWPSKRGNEESSGKKREYVSLKVSHIVDSILLCNPAADIILMGDFNDEYNSPSLKNLEQLENLSRGAGGNDGSYKYRESWSTIDQFLVSENLNGKMVIFAHESLLTEDATYMGIKPKRTYSGPRYLGGVSDHLPIMLKVTGKKK